MLSPVSLRSPFQFLQTSCNLFRVADNIAKDGHANWCRRKKPIDMEMGRRNTLQNIYGIERRLPPGLDKAAIPFVRAKQQIQSAGHQRMIPREKLHIFAHQSALAIASDRKTLGRQSGK